MMIRYILCVIIILFLNGCGSCLRNNNQDADVSYSVKDTVIDKLRNEGIISDTIISDGLVKDIVDEKLVTNDVQQVFSKSSDWLLFRGDPSMSGFANVQLPKDPVLLWTFKSDARTSSRRYFRHCTPANPCLTS